MAPLVEARREARARDAAYRWLERRWRHVLDGRPLPAALRRRLIHAASFQRLVAQKLAGDPLAADDLSVVPVVEQAPDGKIRNRMLEELAGDPREFFCPGCGEEQAEPASGPCEPCRHFHHGG